MKRLKSNQKKTYCGGFAKLGPKPFIEPTYPGKPGPAARIKRSLFGSFWDQRQTTLGRLPPVATGRNRPKADIVINND